MSDPWGGFVIPYGGLPVSIDVRRTKDPRKRVFALEVSALRAGGLRLEPRIPIPLNAELSARIDADFLSSSTTAADFVLENGGFSSHDRFRFHATIAAFSDLTKNPS